MVDSSDTDRLAIAKDEFHAILEVLPLVIQLSVNCCVFHVLQESSLKIETDVILMYNPYQGCRNFEM